MGNHLESKNRLPYVDVAKGIGILLVILGHNAACEPGSQGAAFIYSFHMPLFYFLAGLFHNDTKSLVSHVLGKTKSLLLPCVWAFAAWLAVQAITNHDAVFSSLREIAIGALYGTGKTLFWGQLWFLTSLFVTTCACHALIRSRIAKDKRVRLAIAILLVPVGTLYPPFHLELYSRGLPWNIDLLPITLVFYLAGTVFPKQNSGYLGPASSPYFFASAMAFALVGAGWSMDWGMDLNIRRYSHWLGSSLVAACGIGGVLSFSLALDKLSWQDPSKTLSFIGKRSLSILVLHFSLQQNSFAKMIAADISLPNAYVGSFVIGLSVPIGFSLLWEKIRKKTSMGGKATT
jgi:polysaccharide biosynthesis protein PslL